jgi:hypothetical protein
MAIIDSNELLEMLNGLVTATREKKLVWKAFADNPYEYTANTAKFTFYVRSRDEDDAAPHGFQVFKSGAISQGALVDIVTRPENQTLMNAVNDLYTQSKLSAFGVVSLTKEVLDDLGNAP